jgi:hypothetical protein
VSVKANAVTATTCAAVAALGIAFRDFRSQFQSPNCDVIKRRVRVIETRVRDAG